MRSNPAWEFSRCVRRSDASATKSEGRSERKAETIERNRNVARNIRDGKRVAVQRSRGGRTALETFESVSGNKKCRQSGRSTELFGPIALCPRRVPVSNRWSPRLRPPVWQPNAARRRAQKRPPPPRTPVPHPLLGIPRVSAKEDQNVPRDTGQGLRCVRDRVLSAMRSATITGFGLEERRRRPRPSPRTTDAGSWRTRPSVRRPAMRPQAPTTSRIPITRLTRHASPSASVAAFEDRTGPANPRDEKPRHGAADRDDFRRFWATVRGFGWVAPTVEAAPPARANKKKAGPFGPAFKSDLTR